MSQTFITVVLGIPFNDKGQVLLSQRYAPHAPAVHHKWQLIGGGIEFGELPEQALAREFQEETQLSVEILFPNPVVNTSVWRSTQLPGSVDTHATLLAYLIKVHPEEPNWSNDPETADMKWWSIEEIESLDTLPHTLETIVMAQSLLKY